MARGLLQSLVALSILRPGLVLVGWAVVVSFSFFGLLRLEIDTTIGSSLVADDRAWQEYEASLATFGGDEFVSVVLEGDSPYQHSVLEAVLSLTTELANIRGVRRVDSIASVPLINASSSGELLLDPPLSGELLRSESGIERLKAAIAQDWLVDGNLVSEDGRAFALNVILDGDVRGDRLFVVGAIRRSVSEYGGLSSGVPVFRDAVSRWTRAELRLFVPITAGLILVVLSVALGSLRSSAVSICVGLVGCAVGLGLMGWLGATLTVTTMLLPSTFVALGCAYSMHIITSVDSRAGRVDVERIRLAVGIVVLSGFTTALGFGAMASIRVQIVRDLALYGALGVLAVAFSTASLAPAMVSRWSLGSGERQLVVWIREFGTRRLVGFVSHRWRSIIVCSGLVTLAVAAGIGRLDVSSDVIRWFPHGSDVRDSYEEIKRAFSGITPVNVVVHAPQGRLVSEPEIVQAISGLTTHLESLPSVGRAVSVADPLRKMNEVFGGASRLPDSVRLNEQYLLLLEGFPQLSDFIYADRTSANVKVRVDNNGSKEILEVADAVNDWWGLNGIAGSRVVSTGIMHEFGRSQDQIAIGQSRGLALAGAVIFLVLLLVLRSVRKALIVLVPNVIPIALMFGSMGLVGVPLDAATACLGGLALGIAVDDSLHVAVVYDRLDASGWAERLQGCLRKVLPALCLTTVVVSVGFATLAASSYTLVRNFGAIVSGMVLLCLAADVVLLPALLRFWEPRER